MATLYALADARVQANATDSADPAAVSASVAVTLPVCLSAALLKFMAGRPITANDVRSLDPVFFKNRMEVSGGVFGTCISLLLNTGGFSQT